MQSFTVHTKSALGKRIRQVATLVSLVLLAAAAAHANPPQYCYGWKYPKGYGPKPYFSGEQCVEKKIFGTCQVPGDQPVTVMVAKCIYVTVPLHTVQPTPGTIPH
jgi:hypothetical protein